LLFIVLLLPYISAVHLADCQMLILKHWMFFSTRWKVSKVSSPISIHGKDRLMAEKVAAQMLVK